MPLAITLSSASDLAGAPENVIAIRNVAWTEDVIQNYKDSQDDNART